MRYTIEWRKEVIEMSNPFHYGEVVRGADFTDREGELKQLVSELSGQIRIFMVSPRRYGKTSLITHDGRGVFAGIPSPFEAIRYHSLAIEPSTVPAVLEVSARSESGVIMGIRHREFAIEGVQFHPESIMTQYGHELLANFLAMHERAAVGGTR